MKEQDAEDRVLTILGKLIGGASDQQQAMQEAASLSAEQMRRLVQLLSSAEDEASKVTRIRPKPDKPSRKLRTSRVAI